MDTLSELKNKLSQNKENRKIYADRFATEAEIIASNENRVANTLGKLLEKDKMELAADRENLRNTVLSEIAVYDNKLNDMNDLMEQLNENITNTEHLNRLYATKREHLETDLQNRQIVLEQSYNAKEESLRLKHAQLIADFKKQSETIRLENDNLQDRTRKLEEFNHEKLLIFIGKSFLLLLAIIVGIWVIRYLWVTGQNFFTAL